MPRGARAKPEAKPDIEVMLPKEYENDPILASLNLSDLKYKETSAPPPGKQILFRPEKVITKVPTEDEEFDKLLDSHKKEDYIAVHDNIINVINETESVISDAGTAIAEKPTPFLLNAFASLVKTFADLNKQLLDMRKEEARSSASSAPASGVTNNNIFVGTTEDIISSIKNGNK